MIEVSYRKEMGKVGKDKIEGATSFQVSDENRVLSVFAEGTLVAVYDHGEWTKAHLIPVKKETP